MTRYRRWPSYQAWRLLSRTEPRIRDMVLPYFEQPKIAIRWDGYAIEAERMKADIFEKELTRAALAMMAKNGIVT